MSTIVTGRIALDILFNEVISSGLKAGPLQTRFSELVDLATGTLDNQINKGWAKRETGIGSAVTTAYDLIGSLTDSEGTTVNFDEVVLIAIKNRSETAANVLEVGPAASNGFGVLSGNKGFWKDVSDRNVIAADGGSWMVLHSKGGANATAGTGDILNVITQSGTSANTWDILILGRDN